MKVPTITEKYLQIQYVPKQYCQYLKKKTRINTRLLHCMEKTHHYTLNAQPLHCFLVYLHSLSRTNKRIQRRLFCTLANFCCYCIESCGIGIGSASHHAETHLKSNEARSQTKLPQLTYQDLLCCQRLFSKSIQQYDLNFIKIIIDNAQNRTKFHFISTYWVIYIFS